MANLSDNDKQSVNTEVKRILFIDDEYGRFLVDEKSEKPPAEDIFRQVPVKESSPPIRVEWFVAKDIKDALGKLDEWAKEGHAADLVSIDPYHHERGGGVGLEYWNAIAAWELLHPDACPKKKMFHTGGAVQPDGRDSPVNGADIYSFSEIEKIRNFNWGTFPPTAYDGITSPKLIPFLNSWGMDYPETKEELLRRYEKSGALEINQIYDKIERGALTPEAAISQLIPDSIKVFPQLDSSQAKTKPVTFDRSAAGGVSGFLAFTEQQVDALKAQGRNPILVLPGYTPEVMGLLSKLKGLVELDQGSAHEFYRLVPAGISALAHGAMEIKNPGTAEAALVDKAGNMTIKFGQPISICNGKLYAETLPLKSEGAGIEEENIAKAADEIRRKHSLAMKVYANVDSPEDIEAAIKYGAEGIGLTRTEHFLHRDKEAQQAFRELLKANPLVESDQLYAAYQQFYAIQRDQLDLNFRTIQRFAGRRNFPVTVRLLDAPPDEFFDRDTRQQDVEALEARLGGKQHTRGAKLALKYRELYVRQADAIFDAAKQAGFDGELKIMVPLVYNAKEVGIFKTAIGEIARRKQFTHYRFGVMAETLESIEDAEAIARVLGKNGFISVGSNDLTEAETRCSRADYPSTFAWMQARGDVYNNPFRALVTPVISRIQTLVETVRGIFPDFEIGICGDQVSGDDHSIRACQKLELNSISLAPAKGPMLKSRILACKVSLEHETEKQHAENRDLITPVARAWAVADFSNILQAKRIMGNQILKKIEVIKEIDSLKALEDYLRITAAEESPFSGALAELYLNCLRRRMGLLKLKKWEDVFNYTVDQWQKKSSIEPLESGVAR